MKYKLIPIIAVSCFLIHHTLCAYPDTLRQRPWGERENENNLDYSEGIRRDLTYRFETYWFRNWKAILHIVEEVDRVIKRKSAQLAMSEIIPVKIYYLGPSAGYDPFFITALVLDFLEKQGNKNELYKRVSLEVVAVEANGRCIAKAKSIIGDSKLLSESLKRDVSGIVYDTGEVVPWGTHSRKLIPEWQSLILRKRKKISTCVNFVHDNFVYPNKSYPGQVLFGDGDIALIFNTAYQLTDEARLDLTKSLMTLPASISVGLGISDFNVINESFQNAGKLIEDYFKVEEKQGKYVVFITRRDTTDNLEKRPGLLPADLRNLLSSVLRQRAWGERHKGTNIVVDLRLARVPPFFKNLIRQNREAIALAASQAAAAIHKKIERYFISKAGEKEDVYVNCFDKNTGLAFHLVLVVRLDESLDKPLIEFLIRIPEKDAARLLSMPNLEDSTKLLHLCNGFITREPTPAINRNPALGSI